ncbi:putative LRR receptor-like serine/threonine-protein kinase [Prunus yedoensis var. nudiflora]|uniref:Putative LRR receptor-like serine/threonine-protein kinase n=1 Tax=Prunus yedoensis var. nudiflora TaxID=2094558 RepID=A0A314Z1H9_PRUYE|nr:putative LRR receptor-like serine/threonine-protein kinase [Prunus yedoensis var. nudiflora]
MNLDQRFPQLVALYLSENHLNGTIPLSICNLKNLLVLSLRSNELSGKFPQAWSLLQEIWVIDVAYNNLSGKLPNSIGVPGIKRAPGVDLTIAIEFLYWTYPPTAVQSWLPSYP